MLSTICRYFRRPTAAEAARDALASAQRELLHAQASREYYEAMVGCLKVRIKRLEAFQRGEA